VSARTTQEISEEERRYEDGTDPKVLDIVAIEMIRPLPQLHQQENHLIDDRCYWVKRGTVSWGDLQRAVEDPAGPLWINGYSSSQGRNDRIPEDRLSRLTGSLCLVWPNRLSLIVATEGGDFGPPRRRVRAGFDLCGHSYCIIVTDPWMERQYLAKPDGETALEETVLCVSLAEVFYGYAYKLAAAVITPQRAGS
jgi:hypothetical protein